MGGFQGSLGGVKATELGSTAVRAALERAGVEGEQVEQIFMGNVLPGGLGQAPARQAALGAGLPKSVEATTLNKMCGSGLQAAIMADDALAAGSAEVVVAGGMESMSNAPYLLTNHRGGARIGHDVVSDSMYLDGLEDAYEPGKPQVERLRRGECARFNSDARRWTPTLASKACAAPRPPSRVVAFAHEIVLVQITSRKGVESVTTDEQPLKADPGQDPDAEARNRQGQRPPPPPTPRRSSDGARRPGADARLGRRAAGPAGRRPHHRTCRPRP